jgi:hypothetical protein
MSQVAGVLGTGGSTEWRRRTRTPGTSRWPSTWPRCGGARRRSTTSPTAHGGEGSSLDRVIKFWLFVFMSKGALLTKNPRAVSGSRPWREAAGRGRELDARGSLWTRIFQVWMRSPRRPIGGPAASHEVVEGRVRAAHFVGSRRECQKNR